MVTSFQYLEGIFSETLRVPSLLSMVFEVQHDFSGLRFMKFLKWELV